jgi:hypothetical protein
MTDILEQPSCSFDALLNYIYSLLSFANIDAVLRCASEKTHRAATVHGVRECAQNEHLFWKILHEDFGCLDGTGIDVGIWRTMPHIQHLIRETGWARSTCEIFSNNGAASRVVTAY